MTKFLFNMESVGATMWANRHKIIKRYKESGFDFVDVNQSCGISKADFDMMVMELGLE